MSLALLAAILLGLDAMALSAARVARATYCVAIASNQLDSMEERLAGRARYHDIQEQLQRWNRENQALLPAGRGQLEGLTLRIYWGEVTEGACPERQAGLSGCLSRQISMPE